MRFHARMGYSLLGTFHHCGYKFHCWYDMVWMERLLGEHRADQPPVLPYPQIHEQFSDGVVIID